MRERRGTWRLRRPAVALLVGVLAAGCSAGQDVSSQAGQPAIAPDRAAESDSKGLHAEQQQNPAVPERQVVRTADLGLEAADVTGAAARVRGLAEAAGGHLAQEDSYRGGTDLVLRVPSERLDRLLDEIAGLGEVTTRSQRAEDVTDQIVDTRSRIESQRASVQRLRALMERATSVADIVRIESELSSRESELDALLRRDAALSGQVDLATLDVRISAPPSVAGDDDDTGFLSGLAGGWNALTAVGAFALTALGAVLPFAVVLAVPAAGGGGWLLLRRRRLLRRSEL
ncbi:DUF4349 domain-containing protein [Saccharopolyspora erythraea]|uniref:DUF4349 domain-containing protein n=1 Tax=Saccharopolyspora erythraea TaxID=1836 RepID=UPI001BA45217|nr:DUF4349 domain-containing protein [Saccharopolyspora erythraea]QUH05312.1 DUF4349 domain-containing protein [Saccharopolyspora erythraea]